MNATIINALVPDINIIDSDGVKWFLIFNEGTFDAFKALPKVVLMDDTYFVKSGWNSDDCSVSYKETPKNRLAIPV